MCGLILCNKKNKEKSHDYEEDNKWTRKTKTTIYGVI